MAGWAALDSCCPSDYRKSYVERFGFGLKATPVSTHVSDRTRSNLYTRWQLIVGSSESDVNFIPRPSLTPNMAKHSRIRTYRSREVDWLAQIQGFYRFLRVSLAKLQVPTHIYKQTDALAMMDPRPARFAEANIKFFFLTSS